MKRHTIYKSEQGKKAIHEGYKSYLSRLNVDFERLHIPTKFGSTHTLVTGPDDGKPVFIFQGGNCINPMTLSWFSSLFKEYRVIAPDTPGHPGYSDETRMSGRDESFALWISDLMKHFNIEKSAFVGPSFGGGIILRLATFMPEKIACSVLVSPAGIHLGSKLEMIIKILLPLMRFKMGFSEEHLKKITDIMSLSSMKEADHKIISAIFKHVKLEQDMPRLTTKDELTNYNAPTMILSGQHDIFFPGDQLNSKAQGLFSNLITSKAFDMGHFPDEDHLVEMNEMIKDFLKTYY